MHGRVYGASDAHTQVRLSIHSTVMQGHSTVLRVDSGSLSACNSARQAATDSRATYCGPECYPGLQLAGQHGRSKHNQNATTSTVSDRGNDTPGNIIRSCQNMQAE